VELNMATSSCACSSNIDIAALQVLQESLRHQAPSNVGADVASVLSYVSGQVESEYAKIADDEIIIGEEDGSWLTRLEKIGEAVVLTAVDEIPVVGGVLSNLLSLIWPSSDDEYDIWALIIGEVKELVDVAILEFELSEREGDFLGLRRDLTRYTRANTDTEKGNDLTVALAKVEDLIAHLTISTNKYQLLPLTIVAATIHCSILKERITNGKILYGMQDPSWDYALQAAVSYYQTFFNFTYDLWKDWRKTKIESSTSQTGTRRRRCCTGCDMTVTDDLTNNKYSLHWSNDDDICDTIAEMTVSRVLNEACGYMAKALQPIMYLQRYIPGMESAKVQVLPAVEQITVGPYAAVTQDTEDGSELTYNKDAMWYANEDGEIGDITTTSVWAYNVVDSFRLQFSDGGEERGGSSTGGQENSYGLSDKYITAVTMYFRDPSSFYPSGEVVEMSLSFSDGTSTGILGGYSPTIVANPVGMTATVADDASYKMVGATLGSSKDGYFGYLEATFQFVELDLWQAVESAASSNLTTGDRLEKNQALQSPNGQYKLLVEETGNVAIYNIYDRKTWETDTGGQCTDDTPFLTLQEDGNLVLYCGNTTQAIWATGTEDTTRQHCRVAALEVTGYFSLYNVPDLTGVWSSSGTIPVGFGRSNLTSPDVLFPGMRLVQKTFYDFTLSLSEGGNVTLKDWSRGKDLWSTGTSCDAAPKEIQLKMQEDGNLVLYCDGVVAFATDTADTSLEGEAGVNTLLLEASGNLKIINKRGESTWTSGTQVAYDYFPKST